MWFSWELRCGCSERHSRMSRRGSRMSRDCHRMGAIAKVVVTFCYYHCVAISSLCYSRISSGVESSRQRPFFCPLQRLWHLLSQFCQPEVGVGITRCAPLRSRPESTPARRRRQSPAFSCRWCRVASSVRRPGCCRPRSSARRAHANRSALP